MALKRVICSITVKFETGEEAPDDLMCAVIKTQGYMADKMNAKGIERFNDLTKYLDISNVDYASDAIDAYEKLANACWSSALAREGYPEIKIVQTRHYRIPGTMFQDAVVTIAKR